MGMSPIKRISALARGILLNESIVQQFVCAPLILIAEPQLARFPKRSAAKGAALAGSQCRSTWHAAADSGRIPASLRRTLSRLDSGPTDRCPCLGRRRLCLGERKIGCTQPVERKCVAGQVGLGRAIGGEQDTSRSAGRPSGRCSATRSTTFDSTSSRSTSRPRSIANSRRFPRLSRRTRIGRAVDCRSGRLRGDLATLSLDSIHRRKHDRIPSAVRQLVGLIPAVMPEKKDRSALLSVL